MLTIVAIVSVFNVVCQAQPQSLLTRHTRDIVLNGQAKLVGPLPSTETMHVDIVLALHHEAELQNFIEQLNDRSSVNYHKFITPPEFTARFGPSQEEFDAVIKFAKANGFEVLKGSLDS